MKEILIEKKIFSSKDLQILENDKLKILKIIDTFEEKKINLPILTNELLEVFLKIDLTEDNIEKLSIINFDECKFLYMKSLSSLRFSNLYKDFIVFLSFQFGLEKNYDTQQISLLELGSRKDKQKEEKNFNSKLFEKKENFNYEYDLKEKCKKYKVNVSFNYNEPSSKISVQDFILYFNCRLKYFTEILSNKVLLENLVTITYAQNSSENNVITIIGLIDEISKTKNGHYIITLEDKTGQIKCFVNKEKKNLCMQVENLCLDEGIGVIGKTGKNIIWVDEFVLPTPKKNFEIKKKNEENYIGFLSDIHFGANVFVEEAFSKFLDFINCKITKNGLDKIAKKIEYILIAGDIIEGIGVYPNQGKDAKYISTDLHYFEATRWLSQIPKNICLIIIPGNHDTDRLSEPQPPLPYEKAYSLYNMENVIMLSNPCRFSIYGDETNGFDCYMYHGGSIFYYANNIKSLREKGGAKVPEEVIKYLLEKRHIAPSHGATLCIPDSQRDPLIIKKMPDLFVTGHTHKLSFKDHKGCTIVSCGCWVEMSDYQEKMGMFPDVGKFPVVNTKTREKKILNFYTEKYRQEKEK